MTEHPITPPPELVQQWIQQYGNSEDPRWQTYEQNIAIQAARWASEVRLKECVEWVANHISIPESTELRAAMTPKPPSLAEQALDAWTEMDKPLDAVNASRCYAIRRALERLRELEGGND